MDYKVKYLKYKAKYLQLLEQIGSGSNEDNMLIDAVKKGDINGVILALDQGANVNFDSGYGRTPLILAVRSKNIQIVELLLNRGANVNHMYPLEHEPPLGHAITINNIQIVELLLDRGANVNYISTDGHTALFVAVLFGNIQIVELLLNRGAYINQISSNGETPIVLAIFYYRIEIIKLLLMRGANINETILQMIKEIPDNRFQNPADKEAMINFAANMLIYSIESRGIGVTAENVEDIVSFNKP